MKNFATLGKNEMKQVVGGDITALVEQMLEQTPAGGSSTWTNRNDGCFNGTAYYPENCCPPMTGLIACY
jgi:hypothetical protein